MSTKIYCDKCKKDLSETSEIGSKLTIENIEQSGPRRPYYSYDLCFICVKGVLLYINDKTHS